MAILLTSTSRCNMAGHMPHTYQFHIRGASVRNEPNLLNKTGLSEPCVELGFQSIRVEANESRQMNFVVSNSSRWIGRSACNNSGAEKLCRWLKGSRETTKDVKNKNEIAAKHETIHCRGRLINWRHIPQFTTFLPLDCPSSSHRDYLEVLSMDSGFYCRLPVRRDIVQSDIHHTTRTTPKYI